MITENELKNSLLYALQAACTVFKQDPKGCFYWGNSITFHIIHRNDREGTNVTVCAVCCNKEGQKQMPCKCLEEAFNSGDKDKAGVAFATACKQK